MHTLRNVKIDSCKGPKDDLTRSFHVIVRPKRDRLIDLSVYDRSMLVDVSGHHGVPLGVEYYGKHQYEKLVGLANSKIGLHVDIDFIDYVIVDIREPTDGCNDSVYAAIFKKTPVNSGTIDQVGPHRIGNAYGSAKTWMMKLAITRDSDGLYFRFPFSVPYQ